MSTKAREIIADPDNLVMMSSASAWEIATKYRLGKLPEAGEAVHQLPQLLERAQISVLPITVVHALKAGLLPGPHRDPFDRMLIAQAAHEELPLVTLDPAFNQYEIELIW
nr:type II toxin-antitoxin system VapC family toxin [Thermithiobacillus tepidarius]